MRLEFKETAYIDLKWWIRNDKKKALRIFELLSDIEQHLFTGMGKPEQLKYQLQGKWSRRIDIEHRLIYSIENETIIIFSCKYHYK